MISYSVLPPIPRHESKHKTRNRIAYEFAWHQIDTLPQSTTREKIMQTLHNMQEYNKKHEKHIKNDRKKSEKPRQNRNISLISNEPMMHNFLITNNNIPETKARKMLSRAYLLTTMNRLSNTPQSTQHLTPNEIMFIKNQLNNRKYPVPSRQNSERGVMNLILNIVT